VWAVSFFVCGLFWLSAGFMVPGGGVEPPRAEARRILSPNPFVPNSFIYVYLQAVTVFLRVAMCGPVWSCFERLGRVWAEIRRFQHIHAFTCLSTISLPTPCLRSSRSVSFAPRRVFVANPKSHAVKTAPDLPDHSVLAHSVPPKPSLQHCP